MEISGGQMMGKVIEAILVTKPEQLPKLDTGPVHIILRPNLKIRNKNEKASTQSRIAKY